MVDEPLLLVGVFIMENKVCTKCKVKKALKEFRTTKHLKGGYINACQECLKAQKKLWDEANKEKTSEYNKKNKDRSKAYGRKYRELNRERYNESARKNYWKCPQKAIAISRKYQLNNKKKINEYDRIYRKNKRKNDTLYKLKHLLRGRVREAFLSVGKKKNTKTENLIGVSFATAKQHIERQFKKGMTWENHGEWHIDHIIPLASAKNEKEAATLCHYTNLQPLWALDNIKKSNKILPTQTKLTI